MAKTIIAKNPEFEKQIMEILDLAKGEIEVSHNSDYEIKATMEFLKELQADIASCEA